MKSHGLFFREGIEMNPATIFYSWRSNNDAVTKYIRKQIEKSINILSKDGIMLARDEATRSLSGSPDIVISLMSKIEKCSFYVCDITRINGEMNPNVLIELGYAIKALGSDRILLIYSIMDNCKFELPFDIEHFRTYKLQQISDNSLADIIVNNIKILKENEKILPIPETTYERIIYRMRYYPAKWESIIKGKLEGYFDRDYLTEKIVFNDIENGRFIPSAYIINYHHQIPEYKEANLITYGTIVHSCNCEVLDERYLVSKPHIDCFNLNGQEFYLYYFCEGSFEYALNEMLCSQYDGDEALYEIKKFKDMVRIFKNKDELTLFKNFLHQKHEDLQKLLDNVQVPYILEDEIFSIYRNKTSVNLDKVKMTLESNYKFNSALLELWKQFKNTFTQ